MTGAKGDVRHTVLGKGGISATIIADSHSCPESSTNVRVTTYELVYPRFIHSEFMTHRMLSKNAASSRAIPVEKQIENIRANTAMPIHWGKNQPGMSAKEECFEYIRIARSTPFDPGNYDPKPEYDTYTREQVWNMARDAAIDHAMLLHKAGYHKQIVNRLLEPFTFMKTICTGTEYANLFHLRCHPDAQPEFQELAQCMKLAYDQSPSIELQPGDWHVPYYRNGYWIPQRTHLTPPDVGVAVNTIDDFGCTLQDALMISASCCAQVSYRKNDDSIEKARDIYKRLAESKPMHASPFEHQASPMKPHDPYSSSLGPGKTSYSYRQGVLQEWSGNLRGWIQNRQLIDGHVVW